MASRRRGAVGRQADGGQGIERLEDDGGVVGAQRLVDEPRHRLAHARAVGRLDVELVEQDRDPPRLGPPRLDRDELLDDAVLAQLEVLEREAR